MSSLIRIVLLLTLCFAVYQVQLKWLHFSTIHVKSLWWLGFAFLLIPLNLGLEWLRFKKSMEGFNRTREELWSAFLQGLIVSFFTPSIVATTFGRMGFTGKENNAAFGISGLYGGLAQFSVTMGFATLGSCLLMNEIPTETVWIFGSIFLGATVLFFVKPQVLFKLFKRYNGMFNWSSQQKASLLALSGVRYLVFSLQFHALLLTFGQEFTVHQAWVLMLSYGLITLSPSILFGKIVIREAVAVAVFSFFMYPKEPVFIAAFLTWLFNVVLPLIFAVLRILFRWKSHYS
ncbi:MAG: hypothetical protein ACKO5L_05880 [Bacteroidota bacterium]